MLPGNLNCSIKMARKVVTFVRTSMQQHIAAKRRLLLASVFFSVWASVAFSVNKLLWSNTSTKMGTSCYNKATDWDVGNELKGKEEKTFTLSPGELPGYTGWARPEYTLAGHFEVQNRASRQVMSGEEWFVDVTCSSPECQNGGAHFYVRAYGPAVITGNVIDQLDGTYRVVFVPYDAGHYFVEVVLAFSRSPPLEDFPLDDRQMEPGYEGYLLPGFPMFFSVMESSVDTNEVHSGIKRWCNFDDLTVKSSDSGLLNWRWKIVDSVRHKAHSSVTEDVHEVSFGGYQHGYNALGVKMQYLSTQCEMWEPRDVFSTEIQGLHVFDQCISDFNKTKADVSGTSDMHFIYIGDSVMDKQVDLFELMLSRVDAENIFLTKIDTRGGIYHNLENITRTLEVIRETRPNENRFVLFNSGLHDVDKLCCSGSESIKYREEHPHKFIEDGMPCADIYRETLAELVRLVGEFPAELKVFRSSTAGWHKYGNWGFGWAPNETQLLARSPNFVSHFNDIAFDIIAKSGQDIHISDGYWTSLPRPDNTETGRLQHPGKHLVHPGTEVIIALTMNWLLLVLHHFCSSTVEIWNADIFRARNTEMVEQPIE